MNKKYIILGLALLVTGGAALGWTLNERKKEQQRAAYYRSKYGSEPDEYLKQYNEWLQLPSEQQANLPWWLDKYGKTKTEAQLQQEQQERLKADLEQLAAGKKEVPPFADILYGRNWQNELSEYKKQKQLKEYMFTGSISCACTGGAIFIWNLLLWIRHTLIKASAALRKSFPPLSKNQRSNKNKKPAKANPKTEEKILHQAKAEAEDKKSAGTKEKAKAEAKVKGRGKSNSVETGITTEPRKKRQGLQNQGGKQSKVFTNSGFRGCKTNSAGQAHKQPLGSTKIGHGAKNSDKNAEDTAVLVSDEKTVGPVKSSKASAENGNANIKFKDSLKAQTENMEKQMAEFKKMAQGVQKTTIEHSEPLNNTLSELSQQMSAIREYAASQQTRLTKLQDGYDWNITRTFCLRVIRCIDNLENRISQMTEQNMEVNDLEEIKDEMLFALESSGIEQFEPEIDSDYRGQEKFAEAVKEKETCEDSKRTGKVAKVIRPGYQYFIDDENIKIVRPAQIKLFG